MQRGRGDGQFSERIMKGQRIYEVESILDEAVIDYEPHYLIKWKDLPHTYDTWEPLSELQSIGQYLQFWLNKRRTEAAKRADKSKNFKSIRPFLYSGDVVSKKKGKYEQLEKEILTKKKTYEYYLNKQQNCINIDEEKKKPQTEAQFLKKKQKVMDEILNPPERKRKRVKEEDIFQEQQEVEPKKPSCKTEEEKANSFKVVGHINLKDIYKIHRIFEWNGIKCLQVETKYGQRYNIKESDVKTVNPQLLLQFYEDEGIQF